MVLNPTPMQRRPLPPVESLWYRFCYEPITGRLIWRNPPKQKAHLRGRPAGYRSPTYIWIRLLPEPGPYVAHRLIWAWMTGVDPGDAEIDHRDGNKQNNAWSNLRLASESQQAQNVGKKPLRNGVPTSSRYKGVCVVRLPSGSLSITAKIKLNGQTHYLGSFPTEEAAHAAYADAAARLHKDFARVA